MMTSASNIPKNIARLAFFISIWNTEATREPVQAPVPGKGMPTKSTKPQNPYLSICGLYLMALSLKKFATFLVKDHFSINANILFKKRSINGIGNIFPITHIATAFKNGILSIDAAIRPPRSSSIGKSEIIKTTTSLEKMF